MAGEKKKRSVARSPSSLAESPHRQLNYNNYSGINFQAEPRPKSAWHLGHSSEYSGMIESQFGHLPSGSDSVSDRGPTGEALAVADSGWTTLDDSRSKSKSESPLYFLSLCSTASLVSCQLGSCFRMVVKVHASAILRAEGSIPE